ncbi:MAG: gliding motility-associated C-terminal domain-containing protein, partial [Bacteroidota bacterium]
NDTILFSTGLDTLRFKHTWTLEDGTIETRESFTRFYDELGEYPIRLIIEDECLGQIDTSFRDLQITLRQALQVSPDDRACEGGEVTLEAFDLTSATFAWTGPNNLEEEGQLLTLTNLTRSDAGVYAAVGDVSGCKTFPAEVNIMVDTLPTVTIAEVPPYCDARDEAPRIDAGDFVAYEWNTGNRRNPITATGEGVYAVTVTDVNGCRSADSLLVEEFCPTRFYIPTAFSPNADGINDRFEVFAVDFTSVLLQVFDRWGGLLFESSTENPDWDGRVNGEMAPAGTYLYKATVEGLGDDGSAVTRKQSGTVVLVR